MVKFFLKSLIFCFLLASPVFALTPPGPVTGTAFISSKEFTTGSGDYIYTFLLPPGWGMGDMSTSPDGSGSFLLFPLSKGLGCSVKVEKFADKSQAEENLAQIKATFKSTKNLEEGFEAEVPKAFYSCRLQEDQLIQTWYCVPKKTQEQTKTWQSLKDCVSISLKGKPLPIDPLHPVKSVTENRKGWVCHHPEQKLDVTFESFPLINCKPNEENDHFYLLEFNDFRASGYFYIKWDVQDLEVETPYKDHLQDMLKELNKMEPKQKVNGDPEVNLQDGYGIINGVPYTLVSISGDGFLFGFVVKPKNIYMSYDINDLVRRVKWVKLD